MHSSGEEVKVFPYEVNLEAPVSSATFDLLAFFERLASCGEVTRAAVVAAGAATSLSLRFYLVSELGAGALESRLLAAVGDEEVRLTVGQAGRATPAGSVQGAAEPVPAAVAGTGVPAGNAPARAGVAAADAPAEPGAAGGAALVKSIRVDESKVDQLMVLAGELVVTCNALPYVARKMESKYGQTGAARELREQHAALDRLVRELQDVVMGMRLLPAGYIFQKFPRMVRDLARDLGKKVRLQLEGEDTRLDKAIMQAIAEPMVHLVRNALDHGLEPPEERLKLGKPAEGTLVLRALQEGSRIAIEVEDDGRGIDVERVRQKAVAAGLVSPEEAPFLDQDRVLEFLFVSGFSTSDAVTAVSGRGVGLDAVRMAVQSVGGSIKVIPDPGAGTRVRLQLPLTLATSKVLVVIQGGKRYGLPLGDVREMVRIAAADLGSMRGKRVALLRGELVPVVFLGEFLGLPPAGTGEEELCLVVLGSGFALVVDGFVGQEDIVLKPLTEGLGFDPCFAGAAILGDGSVLLVLDCGQIWQEVDASWGCRYAHQRG